MTRNSFRISTLLITAAIAATITHAQTPPATAPANPPATTASRPATTRAAAFPATLPGRGLAHHDFFYAGEAKTQDMYIVKGGKITWSHRMPNSRGEISDAVLMTSGNILLAHQFGITLLSPEKTVIWKFDAPAGAEIHTAVPIGKERIVYVMNSKTPKVVVMNITTNAVEKEFAVPVGNLNSVHGHFRHARLTDAGTLLVAHMDNRKVVEYDMDGKVVWSYDLPTPWSADRLKNGNTLVTASRVVREVDPAGKTVWELTPADLPGYRVTGFQVAVRLPNGNTIVNNWVNQWSETIDPATAPVQAWEVTPDKKIVWALREWSAEANLGPSTIIQLLDDQAAPAPLENAHFGTFK